ncbi:MAG: hypothetical protein K8S94_14810 [Planctomycetia bacterium]|nr:hypothetical protein [Planctomycetia bacterium]
MIDLSLWSLPGPVVAVLGDRVPGIAFGIPLILVASIVFAATHHESPPAIRHATIQWIGWLGGILGAVLVAVSLLGWLA